MNDIATQAHLSPQETILTTAETCSLMRVSYPTLKHLSDSGAITYILLSHKPNSHRRYLLKDVLSFLKTHTIQKK
jgi:hypothetical protein